MMTDATICSVHLIVSLIFRVKFAGLLTFL